jgi:hypothetical protein
MAHLFRVYPELEGPALACLSAKAEPGNPGLLTILRRYGVFAPGGSPKPSGEMIRQALESYQDQREAAQIATQLPLAIATDVKDNRALDDWADDLAVINKGRNVLEKKLRQLTLNFLRMDALANKKRGSTKDRVSACVSSERRSRLNHLPADELVEQLLWSELVSLVQKEWPIFGTVFSDRKQFDSHANVVNERFDAHAKDADQLDLANYRRSLKWLTDRIATI